MTHRLIACSMLLLTAAGCGKPGGSAATDPVGGNAAALAANTVEVTGAPAGIGSYGPGLIATPVFVEQATLSDMFETAAAKLALTHSHADAIRSYARLMIGAHGETSAELKRLVASEKIAAKLPTALDPKHQRMIDDLVKAKPDKFDKLYLDQQEAVHREALGLVNSYAAHGDNAALKRFAGETKPKIQAHLDAATKLDHGGADEKAAG